MANILDQFVIQANVESVDIFADITTGGVSDGDVLQYVAANTRFEPTASTTLGQPITITDEGGAALTTNLSSIDFVGPGVAATNVGDDITFTFSANLNDIATATSDYSLGSFKITDLATPTAANDAANKAYVDALSAGLDPKESIRICSVAPVGGTYNPSGGTAGTGAFTGVDFTSTAIWDGLVDNGVDANPLTLAIGDRVLVRSELASAEITDIQFDTQANMNENGFFWLFTPTTSYYFWIDKGTGADPTPAAPTNAPVTTVGTVVDISGSTTANDVAVIARAAIDGLAPFSAPAPAGDTVTVTHATAESARDSEDGSAVSGALAFTVTTQGSNGNVANGVYVITTAGGSGAMERSTDMDGTPAEEVSGGNYFYTENGLTCVTAGWVLQGDGVLTLNTDPIYFVQFSGAGTYVGGNGIDISGVVISTDLATDPGLEFDSGALRVRVAAGGGVLRDATGLSVDFAQGALGDLSDVTLAAEAAGDILVRNSGNTAYENVVSNLAYIHKTNRETLGVNKDLDRLDPEYNFITPTVDIEVRLPNATDSTAPAAGDYFLIKNLDPANFKIDVKEVSSGGVIQELSTTSGIVQMNFIYDGTEWHGYN